MFKRKKKPSIQVLKVKTETRDVVEERVLNYDYLLGEERKTKTQEEVNFTVVLMVKDGELCTREFNGSWNLSDIKKWEEL